MAKLKSYFLKSKLRLARKKLSVKKFFPMRFMFQQLGRQPQKAKQRVAGVIDWEQNHLKVDRGEIIQSNHSQTQNLIFAEPKETEPFAPSAVG